MQTDFSRRFGSMGHAVSEFPHPTNRKKLGAGAVLSRSRGALEMIK